MSCYTGPVRLPPHLVSGNLIQRVNRFVVAVEVGGEVVHAHLANSGRLHELMFPGAPVLLTPRPRVGRKTGLDLALVYVDGVWVSADARLPNRLVMEAVEEGRLGALAGLRVVRREPIFGGARLDLLLGGPQGQVLVEAKSVTLVEGGMALFPDAPTLRGRRHLQALMEALRQGLGAAVIFVVQREDAQAFSPHHGADPAFARALGEAHRSGVMVLAYRCRVSPQEVAIADPVPVCV